MGADDGPGVHARRPWTTEPSLQPSCLKERRQAHPPAQGRSTKALGWCQHHGERGHGGRARGPSRRSPQASSSSCAGSCQSSAAAGQHGPRAVLCARETSLEARQVARAHSRASPRGCRRPATQLGMERSAIVNRTVLLRASINTYEINSAREMKKLGLVLLR